MRRFAALWSLLLAIPTAAHAVCILPDSDGDGLSDDCDNCPYVANNWIADRQLDNDGDGVGNACDICINGNNAFDADNDGMPDGCDTCPGGSDFQDADGDLIFDYCDNCPTVPNNSVADRQRDTDNDGFGDVCDDCPTGDNNLDADNDGVADACDVCALGDDNVDTDLDLVADACDNCPLVANNWVADRQLDGDNDGVGNACDQCPGVPDDDLDGDGVVSCQDICPLGDDNLDTDGDILPDACDNCPYVSNYRVGDLNADSDNDGVGNACDACPGVNNALDADNDGYGVCGEDCNDANSAIHPGATEIALNGVDEDCAWGDAYRLSQPTPRAAGVQNSWTVTGASASQTTALVGSLQAGSTPVAQCPGMTIPLANPVLVGVTTTSAAGAATFVATVPPAVSGRTARFVSVQIPSCKMSQVVVTAFP